MSEYQELYDRLQTIAGFEAANNLLEWDQEVNLKAGGQDARGDVEGIISAEAHRLFTEQGFARLVGELAATDKFDILSDDQQTVVRETKRELERRVKIPAELIKRLKSLESESLTAWAAAKEADDFKLMEPALSKMLSLKQEMAEQIGYERSPYDALLDDFEPGMTSAQLDIILPPLAKGLSDLVASIKDRPAISLPRGHYPIDAQTNLNSETAAALGFDFNAGRLDISAHPFSIKIHPHDVRLTTRYKEGDFWDSLAGTIHETGHGLYEQGMPAEHFGTPLSWDASMGIHESQSRTWENLVGHNRQFIDFLYPNLVKHFGRLKFGPEQLYRWVNRVEPGPTRVEADEVTYNLHVILRYELEKALIEGNLSVSDAKRLSNI
jgi:carboxypeptidase Taq